jgi:hypothetical protein
MAYDPDIEQFFKELKIARSALARPHGPAPRAQAMQIVALPEPEGDVVAKLHPLGEFLQAPSGEVYFHYRNQPGRRWYVNRSMSTFLEAVCVFNRCCALACERAARDDAADPEASWVLVQLRSELEGIEPLGDPETHLWSATVQDADGGLLRLF